MKMSQKHVLTTLQACDNNLYHLYIQESEQKYNADRKKWLEEKMMLITQAKEAENIRNKEMKKYAEDRERFLKQQNEVVSNNCIFDVFHLLSLVC